MPSNEFYDSTGAPSTGSLGDSSVIRAEFDAIEEGFKKLPTMTGNGNALVGVNSGGTALETKTPIQVSAWLSLTDIGKSPVGAVIAFVGGYFANGSNGSFTNVIGNTAAAVNSLLNASGWYVCNGAAVNSSSSSIFNGANRYLPNITDDRFLMGDTAAGSIGGENSSAQHTHTTGDFTLTTNHIPAHQHPNIAGEYTGAVENYAEAYMATNNIWSNSAYTAYSSSYGGFAGGGLAHNHGATNSAGATENRPLFLSCLYIMRVF